MLEMQKKSINDQIILNTGTDIQEYFYRSYFK